jgi:transcriptional regulator with XRE-family HTH domain
MERAGEKLKRTRERLKLTFRDVEQASQEIAYRRGNDEYAIALSRLADIENKGTLPTIYRIYTLCAIYRLDFDEVLRWYGVPKELLPSESVLIKLNATHTLGFTDPGAVSIPQALDFEMDLNRTTFLSHMIRRWGKMPLSFLQGLDFREHRYAFIGLEDWSMYPVLQPGSLLMIDERRRKIATDGWTNEFDRPIYFLEHRNGYQCGWCSIIGGHLLVQPHPSANLPPISFEFPSEVDVIGQVAGVAMRLEPKKRPHVRTGATPTKSPGQ